jgi:hypothetical protein
MVMMMMMMIEGRRSKEGFRNERPSVTFPFSTRLRHLSSLLCLINKPILTDPNKNKMPKLNKKKSLRSSAPVIFLVRKKRPRPLMGRNGGGRGEKHGGLSFFGYYCSDAKSAMKNYSTYYVDGVEQLFQSTLSLNDSTVKSISSLKKYWDDTVRSMREGIRKMNQRVISTIQSLMEYSNPSKNCFAKLPAEWQKHYDQNLKPRYINIMKAFEPHSGSNALSTVEAELETLAESRKLLRDAYQQAVLIRSTAPEFGGGSYRRPLRK